MYLHLHMYYLYKNNCQCTTKPYYNWYLCWQWHRAVLHVTAHQQRAPPYRRLASRRRRRPRHLRRRRRHRRRQRQPPPPHAHLHWVTMETTWSRSKFTILRTWNEWLGDSVTDRWETALNTYKTNMCVELLHHLSLFINSRHLSFPGWKPRQSITTTLWFVRDAICRNIQWMIWSLILFPWQSVNGLECEGHVQFMDCETAWFQIISLRGISHSIRQLVVFSLPNVLFIQL